MATKETKPCFTATPKADITNLKAGNINSVCSCHECDSMMCFAKRCGYKPCSCNQCKNSTTCLFYSNDKTELNISQSNNSKIIRDSSRGSTSGSLANNLVDGDLLYDQNMNNNSKILLRNPTRLLLGGLKDKCHDYRLNRSKDISTTQIQSMPIACSRKELNSPTAKLSAQIMDLPYTDFKESISYSKSDVSSYKTRKNSKYDIFKRIKEVYKACSCKVCECIVGKSLMIKNDLCKCKPCDCNECKKYMLNQNVDVNTVLVTGCPCIQCTSSKCQGIVKNFDEPTSCVCKPCDCIQCAESFSKPCDCKPCQCIECKSLISPKHNTLIIAPVGEDYNQRNVCQCQPCDCIQCDHGYGASSLMHEMSTGLNRHQNCHCETCVDESCVPDAKDTCKCERRNSFMRKPVERDTHEFDIRQAIVTSELPRKHNNGEMDNQYSTIAMFAALTNNYPKFAMNKKILCDCEECECLVCNCADNAVNSIKSSQLFDTAKVLPNISKRSLKKCKCLPCECQYCAKRLNQEGKTTSSEKTMGRICECDVCDCFNCEKSAGPMSTFYNKIHSPSKNFNKFSSRIRCICDPCECRDCKLENTVGDIDYHDKTRCFYNVDEKCSGVIYPVKKAKLLTPDMFENKKNSSENYKYEYRFGSEGNFPRSAVHKYCQMQTIKSEKDFPIYHVSSQHSKYSTSTNYITKEKLPLNVKRQSKYFENALETQSYETSNQSEISLYDTNIKCKNMHASQLNKNQNSNRNFTGMNFTGMSSFNFQSKMTQQGESTLPLLVDKYNYNCDVSSCNSSGHVSTDYLIKFPTKTVTKCIDDIINFDVNKSLKVNRRSITKISGETPPGMRYHNVNDHAEKHLYVNTVVTDRDKEFNKSNQTTCSSTQVDFSAVYKAMLKSRNLSKDMKYLKRFKNHRKTESTQTTLGQQETSKNFVSFKADINSIYRVGRPKIDRRLNEVLMSLSEPEIASKFYSPLDFISNHSILNKRISNILKKEEYLSCKWGNHSLPVFKNDEMYSFQLDINYERMRRTLQEAQAFSLYLANILEKYEKANAEFVSISKKLKDFHNCLLNESSLSSHNNLPLDQIILTANDSNAKFSDVNLLTSQDYYTRDIEKPVKGNNIHKYSSVNKDNSEYSLGAIANNNNLDNNNKVNAFFKLSQEHKNQEPINKTQGIAECNLKMIKNSTNVKPAANGKFTKINKTNKTPGRSHTQEIYGKCVMLEKESNDTVAITKSNKIDVKESYKRYRKLIKRAIIVSKKFNAASGSHVLKECVATETSYTSFSIESDYEKTTILSTNKHLETKTSELNQTEVKSKQRKKKSQALVENKNIGTSTIASSQQPTSLHQERAFDEKVQWPIYKTHFDPLCSEPIAKNAGVCVFANIEKGVKGELLQEAITADNNKDIVRQENKDLADLQRHIKELLELSIVYPATEKRQKKLDDEHSVSTVLAIPNIPSAKSSCDNQKVSFLGLRRVSDHTVLVKWNKPRVMTHVQGYELLVDGRAVQRLIKPTKCMAVVTCLPHTDRVLLTIKTIMSHIKQCGHAPTSSIVYRPRK